MDMSRPSQSVDFLLLQLLTVFNTSLSLVGLKKNEFKQFVIKKMWARLEKVKCFLQGCSLHLQSNHLSF